MCFGIVKANVSIRQMKVVDGLLHEWHKLVSEIDFAFAVSLTNSGNLNQAQPACERDSSGGLRRIARRTYTRLR